MSDQDTPPPPPKPVVNWDGIGFSVDTAGLQVFRVACVAVVVLAIVANMPVFERSFDDYRVTRSFEIILVVAGLGLAVSFLKTTTNAVVLLMGFLVIAGLILPTRDIVRLVLVATGSDRRLDQYYGSSGVASNISGRVPDLARNISMRVEKVMTDSGAQMPLGAKSQLVREITDVLREDRVLTLVERTKARGVYELLEAIDADQGGEFLYRYAENDRLQDDLRFLRYEDLVSITYDDITTTQITPLGRLVVQTENGLYAEDRDNDIIFSDNFYNPYVECTTIPFVDSASFRRLSLTDGVAEAEVEIDEPVFVRLTVLPGEIGNYAIDLVAANTEDLDPYLSLFRVSEEGTPAADGSACRMIEQNDDGAGDLNARIETYLDPGQYILALDRFSGMGSATVRVSPFVAETP